MTHLFGRAARKVFSWSRTGRDHDERGKGAAPGDGGKRGRGHFPRIIVATDLDDTLVDSKDPTRAALKRFQMCWKVFCQPPQDAGRGPWAGRPRGVNEPLAITANTPLLIYVTGRSAERFRDLVLETNNLLNLPGVLITSVGTEIHVHENIKRVFGLADEPPVEDDEDTEMAEEPSPPSSAGSVSVEDDLRRAGFSRDYEWRKTLENSGWNRKVVEEVAAQFSELHLQAASEQGLFKASYEITLPEKEGRALVSDFEAALHERKLPIRVIFSSGRDVDVLPSAASKGEALAFFLKQIARVPASLDLSHLRCVSAAACRKEDPAMKAWATLTRHTYVFGDSGNDVELLGTPGVRGVAVGNARPELVRWLEKRPASEHDGSGSRFYHAQARAADGILEGLGALGVAAMSELHLKASAGAAAAAAAEEQQQRGGGRGQYQYPQQQQYTAPSYYQQQQQEQSLDIIPYDPSGWSNSISPITPPTPLTSSEVAGTGGDAGWGMAGTTTTTTTAGGGGGVNPPLVREDVFVDVTVTTATTTANANAEEETEDTAGGTEILQVEDSPELAPVSVYTADQAADEAESALRTGVAFSSAEVDTAPASAGAAAPTTPLPRRAAQRMASGGAAGRNWDSTTGGGVVVAPQAAAGADGGGEAAVLSSFLLQPPFVQSQQQQQQQRSRMPSYLVQQPARPGIVQQVSGTTGTAAGRGGGGLRASWAGGGGNDENAAPPRQQQQQQQQAVAAAARTATATAAAAAVMATAAAHVAASRVAAAAAAGQEEGGNRVVPAAAFPAAHRAVLPQQSVPLSPVGGGGSSPQRISSDGGGDDLFGDSSSGGDFFVDLPLLEEGVVRRGRWEDSSSDDDGGPPPLISLPLLQQEGGLHQLGGTDEEE